MEKNQQQKIRSKIWHQPTYSCQTPPTLTPKSRPSTNRSEPYRDPSEPHFKTKLLLIILTKLLNVSKSHVRHKQQKTLKKKTE